MTNTIDELTAISLWGTAAEADPSGRRTMQQTIDAIGRALPQVDSRERARLRHRLGYLALAAGDVRTKAIEAFTMMRDGALKVQDRALEGLADCGLSAAYDFIGQRHEALRYAEQAEQIAIELGDQRLLALALNDESQFYKENGENARAHELFQRVVDIGETLHDQPLVMGGTIGLGRTTSMAKAPVAIAHYEKALAMAKAAADDGAVMLCYNNLSDWMIITGRYQEAISLREQMLQLAQQHQMRPDIGRALIGLAKAYTLLGDLGKARELLNKGFPTVVSVGDLEGDLHSSLNLAYLYTQTGDIPRATDLYRQTLERSLAAPDFACAVFAQRALDLLADGGVPAPGIIPSQPVTPEFLAELTDAELEGVVGGAAGLNYTYSTGDIKWSGGL